MGAVALRDRALEPESGRDSLGQKAWSIIRQTGLPATIGQDFHRLRQLYPLTMVINVEEKTNLEAALVQALNAGEAKPEVFRRPLLGKDGAPRGDMHKRLEQLRQKIRAKYRDKRQTIDSR